MATIGVFATILDEAGRVLLVRQNYAERLWTQPGGRVEANESPIEALHREVMEETGHRVEIERFVGAYARTYDDDLVLAFLARTVERTTWRPNDEIAELGYFALGALPEPISARARLRLTDALGGGTGLVRVYDTPDRLLHSFPDL